MRSALLAEFGSPESILHAARELRARGYRDLDAYTPFPMLELEEVLGLPRSRVNWVVLPAAIGGAIFAYLVQWFCNAVDYPLNVGGRPLNSAPAFIPIVFETMVLFGSLAAVIAFFVFARLPALWHPVFEVPGFDRASIDRYWISIDGGEVPLDRAAASAELESLGALFVAWAEGAPS